ncbi:hypothetical protein ACHAW6_004474 [Cyclotella cf. meneghiniana]
MSLESTEMLTGTLIRNEPISIEAHRTCVHATGMAHRKTRHDDKVAYHSALMEQSPPKVNRWSMPPLLACGFQPYRTDSPALNSTKSRRPANLPDQCDGCSTGLMLEHGLCCKRGGLVSICHDDMRNEWAHLCSIALTDLQTVIKPTIFYRNGLQAGASYTSHTTTPTTNPPNTLRDKA